MSAGAAYTPPADPKEESFVSGCYRVGGTGAATAVNYVVNFDESTTPTTVTYTYYDVTTGAVLALTAPEIASFVPAPCEVQSVSATVRLASGTSNVNGTGQDGTTFNFNSWLAGLNAVLGGAALLQAYELVVEAGDANAGPATANRVEFIEPGNANGTGAVRVLSVGESVAARADDSTVKMLMTTPAMQVICNGNSRVLLKVTARRA